jgi:hypothetical protein
MNSRLATSNFVSHTTTKQSKRWLGGRIIPGKGTSDLQVGCTVENIESILGSPDEKLLLDDQYFFIYRKQGIDVDFDPVRKRVQRLFFYGGDVDGHTRPPVINIDGITFRTPKAKVIEVLGQPNCEGGPVRVGRRKESWIFYSKGLQFDFDAKGRVIIISVSDPKLNPAEKC